MKRNATLGLSQLELMISLAIMGVIAVLLANAMNFNRLSLDQSRRFSQKTEMLLAQHTLRNWVEAMPLEYGGETAREFFNGTETEFRFKGLITDGSFSPEDTSIIEVKNIELDGRQTLLFSGTGQHKEKDTEVQLSHLIAQGISAMEISYFGRKSGSKEKAWHTDWDDDTFLPDLVKLEWVYENGTPAPPLTLEPGKVERHRYMSRSSLLPPE